MWQLIVFLVWTHDHRRLSSNEGRLQPKVSKYTKSQPPALPQSCLSTNGRLPPKVIFHWRSSSTYNDTLFDLIFVRTVNSQTVKSQPPTVTYIHTNKRSKLYIEAACCLKNSDHSYCCIFRFVVSHSFMTIQEYINMIFGIMLLKCFMLFTHQNNYPQIILIIFHHKMNLSNNIEKIFRIHYFYEEEEHVWCCGDIVYNMCGNIINIINTC